MQLSITGSQGLAYCAQVFAYEWFVVSCFRLLGGPDRFRPNEDRFWGDWQSHLGRDGRADYWDTRPVKVARLARNCIAHTGGKAKPDLLAEQPEFFISDGRAGEGAEGDGPEEHGRPALGGRPWRCTNWTGTRSG